MLKSRLVIDSKGDKAGVVLQVIREKYERLFLDFIEVELDKKIPWGFKEKVKIRTSDAILQSDGSIRVKFTKDQMKVMSKEQELQRHPPTV